MPTPFSTFQANYLNHPTLHISGIISEPPNCSQFMHDSWTPNSPHFRHNIWTTQISTFVAPILTIQHTLRTDINFNACSCKFTLTRNTIITIIKLTSDIYSQGYRNSSQYKYIRHYTSEEVPELTLIFTFTLANLTHNYILKFNEWHNQWYPETRLHLLNNIKSYRSKLCHWLIFENPGWELSDWLGPGWWDAGAPFFHLPSS